MPEYLILDDGQREVSTIVDLETFRALPIIGVGPERINYLQGFVDATPFNLTDLDDDAIRTAYMSYLSMVTGTFPPAPDTPPEPTPEPNGRPDDYSPEVLAEQEAINAGDVPAPQPADTDMEANQGPQTVQVKCWNCEGTGHVTMDDGGQNTVCNMCRGTGRLTQEVAT